MGRGGPILVNRLLKGHDNRMTPGRKQAADGFMCWLRKNGQAHRGRIILVLSGSVSLEPILEQAGLSAHANIYPAFDRKPWDENTAGDCLGELAAGYGVDLSPEVRRALGAEAVAGYREWFGRANPVASDSSSPALVGVDDVLDLLQHDGYLERRGAGYRFVSALLEDWWRVRHGQNFRVIEHRAP